MNPSSPNTDNSQGGSETARNPYAQGNSFDRPGVARPIMSQSAQPVQPTEPMISAQSTQPIMPQQPIASGTGDIVLQPEAPKKSKKPLVLIIILVIALIGAGVAYFAATSGLIGQQNLIQSDAKASFNRYANYLLYGENSDRPLEGEYDGNKTYTINEVRGSSDIENFLNKLTLLFDQFETDINSINSSNNDSNFMDNIKTYSDNFALVKLYIKNKELDTNELIQFYSGNGLDKTKSYIENYYFEFSSSKSENANKYAASMTEYYKQFSEIIDEANRAGCVQNEKLDEVCTNNISIDSAKMYELHETANNLLRDANESIIRDCWTIALKIEDLR